DTPLLGASERIALWEGGWKLSRKMHVEIARLDDADKDNHRTPRLESARGPVSDGRYGIRLAGMSLELVRLGGGDTQNADAVQAKLDHVTPSGTEAIALGESVRKLWSGRLSEFARLAQSDKLLAADRLGRILNPFDLESGGYYGSRSEPRVR